MGVWHGALVCGVLMSWPLAARTLTVGPGGAFPSPSAAAAVARAGDRITIGPGTYYDCAVLEADDLVVEGTGPVTRLTDKTCAGKAILIAAARNITVRNLTLARARVPDGNGAGIRAEAAGLLVQGVRFENNQDGLLTGDQPAGVLRIENCFFADNGTPDAEHPTGSLIVGHWATLEITDSRFMPGPSQSQIRSGANFTAISTSHIEAVRGGGATIDASGNLSLTGNSVQAGSGPDGRRAAVLALPGSGETLLLRGNTLLGGGTLLLNWSDRAPVLEANAVGADGVLQSASGAWSHRLRAALGEAYRSARHLAGGLRRHLLSWLR